MKGKARRNPYLNPAAFQALMPPPSALVFV
jgi:hypothetical protein